MPPKAKFTKDEIIQTALELVSQKGIEALTAKELGDALGSSARPIFTVFSSMKEVQEAVREAAMRRFEGYAAVQAGWDADGAVRRAGAEALSVAVYAGKPQCRQL